jgi:hypothetical protein
VLRLPRKTSVAVRGNWPLALGVVDWVRVSETFWRLGEELLRRLPV